MMILVTMSPTDPDSSSRNIVFSAKNSGKRNKKLLLYVFLPLLLANTIIVYSRLKREAPKLEENVVINEVKDEITAISPASKVVSKNETEQSSDLIIDADHSQPTITTYTVKDGDTLSQIADKYGISINTIRWANDLAPNSMIKKGDELVILPISGIEYTIKKGDTISAIASKHKANQSEILEFNNIDPKSIKPGMKIVIPEAEPLSGVEKTAQKKSSNISAKTEVKAPAPSTQSQVAKTAEKVASKVIATTHASDLPAKEEAVAQASQVVEKTENETKELVEKITEKVEEKKSEENKKEDPELVVRFGNPISNAILTQGAHDGNAVDFGVAIGTTVRAAASGKVFIAKSSGHNGGYGAYIVISHNDGSQTLYAHLSKVSVSVGDSVSQGDSIGLSGNSGRSTGPHLHYKEIGTGTKNTFAKFKVGTHF